MAKPTLTRVLAAPTSTQTPLVKVPVLIEGRRGAGRDHRRDGEAYERRPMMPVSHFGVGEIELSERLTDAQKEIRIKQLVLNSLGASAGDTEILLHVESNERWTLDPGPEWQISKLEVIEQAGGAPPRTGAFMHRSLAGKPMAHSFLPMPECILDEAWTEGNCIPRQLAALLQTPVSEVELEIEKQSPGWRETDGVSPEMLATYCQALHFSLYLFHAENLVVRNIHPESQGCVIAAIYEDHAYLYQKGSKIQDIVRNRVPRSIPPLPKGA